MGVQTGVFLRLTDSTLLMGASVRQTSIDCICIVVLRFLEEYVLGKLLLITFADD